jgi:diguanylate cyclase (GGDEF)-like protein
MAAALTVAATGLEAPTGFGQLGAPLGPFEWRAHADLDALATATLIHMPDAVLVAAPQIARLAGWAALAPVALRSALVLLLPPAEMAGALPLLRSGVQDVLPAPDTAPPDPAWLARALRFAVERKRLEIATRKAFASDLATGLPNHPQLLEHMSHLLALREREPAPMALIVLKLHGPAATEARLGTEAANVLRRKAAVRLRSALRASDVVASIGTDTFAVLLAWIDSAADGQRVATKLAGLLSQPIPAAGRMQPVTVTVGLASYPEHGKGAEELMFRAMTQASGMSTEGAESGTVGSAVPGADRGPDAAVNDE